MEKQRRAFDVCRIFDAREKNHVRNVLNQISNPNINIVAICAEDISADLARAYHLVADNPDDPKWWKIVVMDHVAQGVLDEVAGKMV